MGRETTTFRRVEVIGGASVIHIRYRLRRAMPSAVRTSLANEAMSPRDETPLPAPSGGAVFKRLPEGGVLFSTETEVYFGVGVVGAQIWELLPPATRTMEEMLSILCAKYHDVPASKIRADVERFLSELLSNGLVAHVESRAQGSRQVP